MPPTTKILFALLTAILLGLSTSGWAQTYPAKLDNKTGAGGNVATAPYLLAVNPSTPDELVKLLGDDLLRCAKIVKGANA